MRVRVKGQMLGLWVRGKGWGLGFSVKGWVWPNVGFRGRV